jgi:hypothetical protein
MVDAETKPAMSVMGETRRTRWGHVGLSSVLFPGSRASLPDEANHTSPDIHSRFCTCLSRYVRSPTIRYVLLCSCEGSTLSEKF